jgi:hypothetical protein
VNEGLVTHRVEHPGVGVDISVFQDLEPALQATRLLLNSGAAAGPMERVLGGQSVSFCFAFF